MKPPVIDVSKISGGPQSILNITDFRDGREESGASGVAVHLTVEESILLGSVICSLAPEEPSAFPQPVEFSIEAAGDNASLGLFHLTKENGEC